MDLDGLNDIVKILQDFFSANLPFIQESCGALLRYIQWDKCIPLLRDGIITSLHAIFAPKHLLRQLAIAIALQTGIYTIDYILYGLNHIRDLFSSTYRQIRCIKHKMNNAMTFIEWKKHAEMLDKIYGYDIWRKTDECTFYNAKAISKRINDIKHMMGKRDIFNLMFRIRGGLSREQFGMQHEGLFSRSSAGTKHLVEQYHHTVTEALNFICDTSDEEVCHHR
jgi:TAG lipase/steryl ester hydrolase/phospholipase A2/LPA acyltransferase